MSGARVLPPWRCLCRRILHHGYLILVQDRVRLPTGVELEYEFIDQGNSSCVLVRTAPGLFLFVRQYRHVVGEVTWELPMGIINPGETPEEAGHREVREEAGVIIRDLEMIGTIAPSNGRSTQRIYLFVASAEGQVSADPEASELLEVHYLTSMQIWNLIESGAISDAATLTTLLLAGRSKFLA